MIVLVDNFDSTYKDFLIDNNIYNCDNPFYNIFLYLIDDSVEGYLTFEYIYDRFEIDYIYVNGANRHKGIGSLLIEELIKYGKKLGINNITLEVKTDNIYAIELYKKYGFNSVALRKKYYNGIDGILMEKEMI